jgi:hypothetical protein
MAAKHARHDMRKDKNFKDSDPSELTAQSRMVTELERAESSTFRELAAIKFALEAFEPALQDSKVKWFTDSQAAAKIIQVGSTTFN